jgi:aspartate aminotransferase
MSNKSKTKFTISKAAHMLSGSPSLQLSSKARELELRGKKIFHFEIGDPDFDTPVNVGKAAIDSIRKGETHYAPPLGLSELREAICLETKKSLGFKPNLKQTAVGPAKAFIYFVARCLLDPGDEVILPDPGFASYYSVFDFMGVKYIQVPLREKNSFRISPDDVMRSITSKTRLIIINSPHNPTGAVMTRDEVKAIYEIAAQKNIYILSDEIYSKIIYKSRHYSPGIYDKCKRNTIILNSFSKAYAMTGWRLGWIVGPDELIKKVGLMIESVLSSIPPFIQKAGIEALRGNQTLLKKRLVDYHNRRDIMVRILNDIPGIKCLKPDGAFYVFPNISGTGMTSNEFAEFALKKAGVVLVPGTSFGVNGEGYVRLTYTTSIKIIKEGLAKLKQALS